MRNYPRVGGIALALLGAGLGKFTIYDVLQQAHAQSTNVSISMKGVVLSIVIVELGLLLLVLGPAYHGLIQHPETKKLTPLGWLTVILMLVPGFGAYFWLQARLTAMGYTF